MSGHEYRLKWQRVGLQPTSRILQTERGAVGKAERLLTLDEVKYDEFEGSRLADMPDLVVMTLERREVGEWEQVRAFDVPEPDMDPPPRREPEPAGDIPW